MPASLGMCPPSSRGCIQVRPGITSRCYGSKNSSASTRSQTHWGRGWRSTSNTPGRTPTASTWTWYERECSVCVLLSSDYNFKFVVAFLCCFFFSSQHHLCEWTIPAQFLSPRINALTTLWSKLAMSLAEYNIFIPIILFSHSHKWNGSHSYCLCRR